MIQKETSPPKTNRKFGTIWGELDYLCKKAHFWLHERKDKSSAKRYLGRLRTILESLPKNNMAIVREEGLALFHELQGNKKLAIKHRLREIMLLEKLHASVQRSIYAGDYDAAMGESILADRDKSELEVRRTILRALEEGHLNANGAKLS